MVSVVVVTPIGTQAIIDPWVQSLRTRGYSVYSHAGHLQDVTSTSQWFNADVLVAAGIECNADDLSRTRRLRAIITLTIGFDGIDIDAASARNILIVNGQAPENFESMAEAIVLLMLALFYDLPGAQKRLRSGVWFKRDRRSQMLKGKTVGLIGYGNIARGVIARLSAWGVNILVHTRTTPQVAPKPLDFVSLEELLAQSDVVVPLANLNSSSFRLLDADRLALVKTGAYLVNVGRGDLVDEAALLLAIESGRISNVALDVFAEEPLPLDSEFLKIPGAILTAHEIGHTRESTAGMMRLAADNIAAVVSGTAPMSAVNLEAIPDWEARFAAL